jgi:hypothetical protein
LDGYLSKQCQRTCRNMRRLPATTGTRLRLTSRPRKSESACVTAATWLRARMESATRYGRSSMRGLCFVYSLQLCETPWGYSWVLDEVSDRFDT